MEAVGCVGMRITVNGEPREVPDDLTVAGLLGQLGLTSTGVAVEQNREIVPRAEHLARRVSEGDSFEVVHFVGGG